MMLKTKLSWGLGFLFIIIFSLVFISSFYIQKLAKESKNILKDNYDSLTYADNMFNSMDTMNMEMISNFLTKHGVNNSKQFELGEIIFDKNLKDESNNITEIHEKEYVDKLSSDYTLFLDICSRINTSKGSRDEPYLEYLSAVEKVRQSINNINDVNMEAVVRKSQMTIIDAGKITSIIAMIGAFCILLAFGYIWYFPFYISNSISYLSEKMKALLNKLNILYDMKNKDEIYVILQGLNLLENKLITTDKGTVNKEK
jgi:NtrC-family two-component system sensor histidine kinase KinB